MWRISSDRLVTSKPILRASSLKFLLIGGAIGGLIAILPVKISTVWDLSSAQAYAKDASTADEYEPDDSKSTDDASQPAKDKSGKQDDNNNQNDNNGQNDNGDQNNGQNDDNNQNDNNAAPPDDNSANDNAPASDKDTGNTDQQQTDNSEIEPLNPGEAVVTRFSHTTDGTDLDGKPIQIIDLDGISASILDIRNPGQPFFGQHWINEPQRMFVTAREAGQLFGVAIAQQEGETPVIFLSATAAYGLHRTATDAKTTDWMEGQWGPDAGPGTIYRLSADNGYKAEAFADVKLDGRDNTGASLGNIAYDKWHRRLFVSDLETGMIHSLDAETGKDMGHYDHGVKGRANFLDAWTGQHMSLDPVAFDPSTSANIDNCSSDLDKTPACWNLADFRRRVWGLKVRSDENGAVRLYYSVWGSDAFGNPDWAKAGDDRRNAVWSVALAEDGSFDTTSVRREFFMPAFWPGEPSFGDKAGNSNAPSDITFPECVPQNTMLVAERGGMRNLGLDKVEAFARPYQSRVVRYELSNDDLWRPKGRYDVGFHDRSIKDGEPLLFASAAGGVDFDYRIGENGNLDLSAPSQSVWMTGDGLCSPLGGCNDADKGEGSDKSEVHGLQGTPADAFVALVPPPKLDDSTLLRSVMIDTDINIGDNGEPVPEEMTRNDATEIGDVAIYQVCKAAEPLQPIDVPGERTYEPPYEEPPVNVPPVHTVDMSHEKWASASHRVRSSWHWRRGSWHQEDRSWHWRDGSWHDRLRSWHWRDGSWHQADRSWHYRDGSWHDRLRSWHWRDGSWHQADRSWHQRDGSWHDRERSWHFKTRSYHTRDRSWGHDKRLSEHVKGRSWGHDKQLSDHVKGRSWGGDQPQHIKGFSFHVKDQSFGNDNHPRHIKGRTWGGDVPQRHNKRLSDIDHNPQPQHSKRASRADNVPTHSKRLSTIEQQPRHLKAISRAENAPVHSRRLSTIEHQPRHLRSESRGDMVPHHSRRESYMGQDHQPRHLRSESRGDNMVPHHSRRESFMGQDNGLRHFRRNNPGDDGMVPQHRRRDSLGMQENHQPHFNNPNNFNNGGELDHVRRRPWMQY
jgi:hypothetical protein